MERTDEKTPVEKRLLEARLRLLDLTMRNRMLNYFTTRKRSLIISGENPLRVFERLVLEEKAMSFRALPEDGDPGYDSGEVPQRFDFEDGEARETPSSDPESQAADSVRESDGFGDEKSTQQKDTEEIKASVIPRHYLEVDTNKGDNEKATDTTVCEPKRFVDLPQLTAEEISQSQQGASAEAAAIQSTEQASRFKAFVSEGIWSGEDNPNPDDKEKNDSFLQTPYSRDELERKLFFVNHEARTVLEEQGYNVLHLALGLLEWYESDTGTPARYAPIVLVPVAISRNRIGGTYSVRWSGDDPIGNLSLKEKLREQFIDLPDFAMPETSEEENSALSLYFASIVKAISKKNNWKLHLNVYLDFFSFTKFVMYKDLDPLSWPAGRTPAEHPLLKELFAPTRSIDDLQNDEGFPEKEIDRLLTVKDMHHIRDADPSQIAVIEDIKKMRNLVVEGPPGTGKSQTITNAIAELLYLGKSVLFVSEKMAALEVVKSRLDDAGLGDFCLEIHSSKSNKRDVLREIARIAAMEPQEANSMEVEQNAHTAVRNELDSYATILKTCVGKSGASLWKLYNDRLVAIGEFEKNGRDYPLIDIDKIYECTSADFTLSRDVLDSIAGLVPSMGEVNTHPWLGFSPVIITPDLEREVVALLQSLFGTLEEIAKCLKETESVLPVNPFEKLSDIDLALQAQHLFTDVPDIDPAILENSTWDEHPSDADTMIAEISDYSRLSKAILDRMKPASLDLQLGDIPSKFGVMHRTILKYLNPSYYSMRRLISEQYIDSAKRPDSVLAGDLVQLADVIERRKRIRTRDSRGKQLFGQNWQCENSDPATLGSLSRWYPLFRKLLSNKTLKDDATAFAKETARKTNEICTELFNRLQRLHETFSSGFDRFIEITKPDFTRMFGCEKPEVSLSSLASKLAVLSNNISLLNRWSQYSKLASDARETYAGRIVDAFEEGRLRAEELDAAFRLNFANGLIEQALKSSSELAMFDRNLHEGKIKRFGELERTIIKEGRKRLVAELSARRPRVTGGGIPGSALGVLTREMAKKRGHIPLRKLFNLSGELIQKLKPCFMMSPLSIAQFLDPTSSRFDVIIFDEASQVRPEDALGALLRGYQLVIMGDDKQLPPTSFFDRVVDSSDVETSNEEDEYMDSNAGLESILGLAKTAFPCKPLKWHYRSRHESLIAVSNYRFYDNMLWIYPSPVTNPDELGLTLVHLPETVYDRGKSRSNKLEAAAVVKAAVEHYRNHPEKSLGIGAFSISQQQAILMEVERVLKDNPELEPYFSSERFEHFFVKNLETIQGDERDVILISVGYGKDRDGKLSMNFGPLNQIGGERRLNVLITRARERCIVFSNFKADDIRTDTAAEGVSLSDQGGVAALKQFLKFAETRILEDARTSEKGNESPFELSVKSFLEKNGYEVQTQVGCAGFRVDLGVLSKRAPGRYMAGIECDGWKYHNSPVARDRDRLRQQILENLGWQIVRIWSTDWYRSRKEAESRLLVELEAAGEIEAKKETDAANKEKREAPSVNEQATRDSEIVSTAETVRKPESGNREKESENDRIAEYEICKLTGVSRRRELVDTPVDQIAAAIVKIVETEWPVHVSEVMKRLREHWQLSRIGSNIESRINDAIAFAVGGRAVVARGDFLYISSYFDAAISTPIRVRKRVDNPKPDCELIAPEEFEAAMKAVIGQQYSIYPDELIKQTAYLLGFKAVSEQTRTEIQKVLDNSVASSRLHLKANGMVELPD